MDSVGYINIYVSIYAYVYICMCVCVHSLHVTMIIKEERKGNGTVEV